MIFRPDPSRYVMGDYWIFEDKGIVHQYFLKRDTDGAFDRIGHATSSDLLRWDEQDDVLLESNLGDWDYAGKISRTGYTLRHEDQYWMAYGAMDAGIEKIGWLVSDDLHHWQRPSDVPVQWPDSRWYEHDPAQTIEFGCFWRDPHFIFVDGAWEAFVCARDNEGAHGGRGSIGRARSQDLINWEYLPPIFAPGRYRGMEVPHYFEMEGRHYFMWSTMSRKGIRLNSPKGQLTAGVYYCLSEQFEGPYEAPADHLLLGENAYVGRRFDFDDDALFTHLNQREYDEATDRPSFALPKRLSQNPDGTLSLRFWSGTTRLWMDNERLHVFGPATTLGLPGEWNIGETTVTGYCEYGPSAVWVNPVCDNFHLACDLFVDSRCRGSILMRGQGDAGVIFTVNMSERQFEIGAASGVRSGLYLKLAEVRPFASVPELVGQYEKHQFFVRLIARNEIVEVYVEDQLIFSRSFADVSLEGRPGFATDTGQIWVKNLVINPISDH